MAHSFGDLLRQYCARKRGLSQTRLAHLAGYDQAVLARMGQGGKDLTGPSGRERVVRILAVLRDEGVLTTLDEANALLKAAAMPPLFDGQPTEAMLIASLSRGALAAKAASLPLSIPPAITSTGEQPLTNLPAALTSFVGRGSEIAEVIRLLGIARLVTLAGPPGVGKTRLAVEAARQLSERFERRVCFVALAGLSEAGQVAPAIAEALEVRGAPDRPIAEVLARHLAARPCLLVLDNFEHLLPAAPFVAELLQMVPCLKVLVTSRAALRVSGEYCFEVPPLPLPSLQHLPAPGDLARCASVDLFAQRAQMVRPGFVLDRANAPAVAEVCCRLDGLPLAIELAAMRTRVFTPQALLEHLDHHVGAAMRLLVTGPRDLPPRQRTLYATLDWSYQLLTAGEQALLQRLAVFTGGCALEAAQAVCGEEGSDMDDPLIANLQSLIDSSLVQQAEGVGGESRYSLLETVREYALERLEASGGAEGVRRRHARYFARKCDLDVNSPDWMTVHLRVFRWLVGERHNLYAALAWSKGCEDEPLLHLHIICVLAWLAHVGRWSLGLHNDDRAIESEFAWSLERNPGIPPTLRSRCLQTLGLLLRGMGELDRAARAEDESLALSLAAGALGTAAGTAHQCGWNAYSACDVALAEHFFAQAMELGERAGTPGWVLNGLYMLGRLALERRDFGRSTELLERALALARSLGVKWDILGGEAVILQEQGLLAYEQGDYAAAYELGQRALVIFEKEGDLARHCIQHLYLGQATLAQRRTAQAEQHLKESVRLAGEYGATRLHRLSLAQLALAALQRGDTVRSARLMGALAGAEPPRRGPWNMVVMLEVDQCVAAIAEAQTHLDDPTFAVAWAEGRAMTPDQAVAYALSE